MVIKIPEKHHFIAGVLNPRAVTHCQAAQAPGIYTNGDVLVGARMPATTHT